MSEKRKSAFSLYSEDKPIEEPPKKAIQNGHAKSKAKLEGVIKKANHNKNAKKMKKKFASIPPPKLSESIGLFSNGAGKEPPSKEFKLIGKNKPKNPKTDKKHIEKPKKNKVNNFGKFSFVI